MSIFEIFFIIFGPILYKNKIKNSYFCIYANINAIKLN